MTPKVRLEGDWFTRQQVETMLCNIAELEVKEQTARGLGSTEVALRSRIAELEDTIRTIRDKVHAHNRGGELYAGLRDVIRDLCDKALAWVKP